MAVVYLEHCAVGTSNFKAGTQIRIEKSISKAETSGKG